MLNAVVIIGKTDEFVIATMPIRVLSGDFRFPYAALTVKDNGLLAVTKTSGDSSNLIVSAHKPGGRRAVSFQQIKCHCGLLCERYKLLPKVLNLFICVSHCGIYAYSGFFTEIITIKGKDHVIRGKYEPLHLLFLSY